MEPDSSESSSDISRILICDDDPTVRLLARECLEAAGLEVAEAEDGEAALKAFHSKQPDLIFLDVDMPKMDGFRSAQPRVNRWQGHPHPHSDRRQRQRFHRPGF